MERAGACSAGRGGGGCRQKTWTCLQRGHAGTRAHGYVPAWVQGYAGTWATSTPPRTCRTGRRVWWVRPMVRAGPTTRTPHETDTSGVSTSTCSPCTHSSAHLHTIPACLGRPGLQSSPCSPDLAPAERYSLLSSPLVPLSLPATRHETPSPILTSVGHLVLSRVLVGTPRLVRSLSAGTVRPVVSAQVALAATAPRYSTRLESPHPPAPAPTRATTSTASPNIQITTTHGRAFQPRTALPRASLAVLPCETGYHPTK